jgi:hypothetical protein
MLHHPLYLFYPPDEFRENGKKVFLLKRMMEEMKIVTVAQFKAHFAETIEWVRSGQKVGVTSGKKQDLIGIFMPQVLSKPEKRRLGQLEGLAKAVFHDDFKMSDIEF